MARKEPKRAPLTSGPSRLAFKKRVPNAFAIAVSQGSASGAGGRLEVGVSQGRQAHGYRLAYNPGAQRSLELLRIGNRGTAVIESTAKRIKLEDGKLHKVQLTRDVAGEIAVRVDGKEIMRTVDRAFRGDFDGVVIINKGGDYTVRSVTVDGDE